MPAPLGSIVSIHIAPAAAAPMQSITIVEALAGRGLEGDRYTRRRGTFTNQTGTGREVTLIESEAIEALERDYGIALTAGQARRNLVTRGIALNHLVNHEFTIGEVRLRGTRLCEPCAHMERLTVKGALRGLVHRGGLRAEIVRGGMIRVGDVIVPAAATDRQGAHPSLSQTIPD
jgi:MOSC domain-containing protein YiiM